MQRQTKCKANQKIRKVRELTSTIKTWISIWNFQQTDLPVRQRKLLKPNFPSKPNPTIPTACHRLLCYRFLDLQSEVVRRLYPTACVKNHVSKLHLSSRSMCNIYCIAVPFRFDGGLRKYPNLPFMEVLHTNACHLPFGNEYILNIHTLICIC